MNVITVATIAECKDSKKKLIVKRLNLKIMLQPKKQKFRRQQKRSHEGKLKGKSVGIRFIWYKVIWRPNGLQVVKLKAARIAVTRYMQRQGQFGSVFSRTNLLQKPYGCVWVKVKVLQKDFVGSCYPGRHIFRRKKVFFRCS